MENDLRIPTPVYAALAAATGTFLAFAPVTMPFWHWLVVAGIFTGCAFAALVRLFE